MRHVPPSPSRAPRWPWALGLALAVVTIAGLEHRRATQLADRRAQPTTADRFAPSPVDWRARRPRSHPHPPRRRALVSISGRVFAAETGRPVAGVQVVASDGASESEVTSGSDGHYQLDVPPGRYRLFVRDDRVLSMGRRRRERLAARPDPGDVAAARAILAPELAVGADLDGVDLEVVEAAVIRGRVVDERDVAVAGAVVTARAIDASLGDPVLATDVAETDAAGRFQLTVPARAHQLEAFHDRFGGTATRPLVALHAGGAVELTLVMVPGCVVTGRVVRDGRLFGDGSLEFAGAATPDAPFSQIGSFTDGRFRWSTDDLVPFVLRAFPFKSPPSAAQTVPCSPTERRHEVTFDIPATPADLSGSITTATGAPAAYAYLDIKGITPGTTDQQERADADGAWESFTLPPGEYVIVARMPGLGVATAHAAAPTADVALRFTGTGGMHGAVRGLTDGTFWLDVDCITDGETWGRTTERFLVVVRGGSYQLSGLPACRLRASAQSGQWRATLPPVDVSASDDATVDLDVRAIAPTDIHGAIVDTRGRAVVGAAIVARGVPTVGAESDTQGRFDLRAPAGTTLKVQTDNGARALEFTVPDAGASTWDVQIVLP